MSKKSENFINRIKNNLSNIYIKVKFKYKYWLFYIWVSFVSIILIPFVALRPRNVKNANVVMEMVKKVSKLVGIKWIVRNQDILSERRAAVIVCNHQSSLDVLGMTNVWYLLHKCATVSKKELFNSPFGLCSYLMGTIFIDRAQGKDALKKIETYAKSYFNEEIKIWIYPEGKRNKDPTTMLPFKNGAFSVAISSQVPIIPLVFSPYYFINKNKQTFNNGHIIIQCLEPIPTEGLTLDGLPDLMDQVKSKMENAYKKLCVEVTRNEL